MKLKQKIIIASSLLLFACTPFALATPAVAEPAEAPKNNNSASSNSNSGPKCGDVKVAILPTSICNKSTNGGNAIMGILLFVVNAMTAGVGILAVGGIVWAAILYTTAEDKPSQVSQAKTIIVNVVIGILAFGFMFALLNFLIPGGIFNA